jgi:hypothetical protein
MNNKKHISILIAGAISILAATPAWALSFADEPAGATPTQETSAQQTPAQKLGLPEDNEAFTIVPAYPNAENRKKFIYELKPGTEISDYVAVQNYANKEVTYLIYPANTTLSNQGTIAFKTRADMGIGTADWITFDEPAVTLKPQQAKLVKFTLKIPEGTAYGDYKAGIAMEKTKQDVNNPGITIASRLIIHVQIKVTQTPQPIAKSSLPAFTIKQDGSNFKTYYFWISLGLFIISLALLIWTWANEKRQQRKTGTHASPNGKSSAPPKTVGQIAKSSAHRPPQSQHRNPRLQRGAKHRKTP